MALFFPIGFGGTGAGYSQESARPTDGWFFDSRPLADMATKNQPHGGFDQTYGKFDQPTTRRGVWELARRLGPLAAHAWLRPPGGHERARLTLLGALGLSGGNSAREYLLKGLRRARPETEFVFMCLAAARDPVACDSARLLRFAEDASRKEVERLAARIALLATSPPVPPRRFLDGLKDKHLESLLNSLYGAWHAGAELPAATQPLGSGRPPEGSLEEFETRAMLLLAAARPNLFSSAAIEELLAATQNVQRIASLALGRLHENATIARMTERAALDQPLYLCGLEAADPKLQAWLLERGPSDARSEEWRSLWWAATVRLLSSENAARAVPRLLDAGPEGDAGLRMLCWRLLHEDQFRPALAGETRERLVAPARPAVDRFRFAIAFLTAATDEDRPSLGTARARAVGARQLYALRLFRDGRLGGRAEPPGPLLWRQLNADAWIEAPSGAFEAAFLAQFNELVKDLFVGGRTATGERVYLPAGIRTVRNEYFEVLEQLLAEYPLFRRLVR